MTPRRDLIKKAALWLAGLSYWQPSLAAEKTDFYPQAKPRRLVFPADYGAHPDYRTEWWYLTGWLGQGSSAIGFQLTFFVAEPNMQLKIPADWHRSSYCLRMPHWQLQSKISSCMLIVPDV